MTSTLTSHGGHRRSDESPLREKYAALGEAKCLQFVWKTEAMMAMLLAVVHLALDRHEFSAADLPTEMIHGGTGIAGSVFAELCRQEIIERVGIWQGEGKERAFFEKTVVTSREGRKSAKVGVYRLADQSKAEAFLRAKHRCKELKQPDLLTAN